MLSSVMYNLKLIRFGFGLRSDKRGNVSTSPRALRNCEGQFFFTIHRHFINEIINQLTVKIILIDNENDY